MNAFNSDNYEPEFEYQAEKRRSNNDEKPQRESRSSRPNYTRGSSRPGAHNGIHRRRNKRWSW